MDGLRVLQEPCSCLAGFAYLFLAPTYRHYQLLPQTHSSPPVPPCLLPGHLKELVPGQVWLLPASSNSSHSSSNHQPDDLAILADLQRRFPTLFMPGLELPRPRTDKRIAPLYHFQSSRREGPQLNSTTQNSPSIAWTAFVIGLIHFLFEFRLPSYFLTYEKAKVG